MLLVRVRVLLSKKHVHGNTEIGKMKLKLQNGKYIPACRDEDVSLHHQLGPEL